MPATIPFRGDHLPIRFVFESVPQKIVKIIRTATANGRVLFCRKPDLYGPFWIGTTLWPRGSRVPSALGLETPHGDRNGDQSQQQTKKQPRLSAHRKPPIPMVKWHRLPPHVPRVARHLRRWRGDMDRSFLIEFLPYQGESRGPMPSFPQSSVSCALPTAYCNSFASPLRTLAAFKYRPGVRTLFNDSTCGAPGSPPRLTPMIPPHTTVQRSPHAHPNHPTPWRPGVPCPRLVCVVASHTLTTLRCQSGLRTPTLCTQRCVGHAVPRPHFPATILCLGTQRSPRSPGS